MQKFEPEHKKWEFKNCKLRVNIVLKAILGARSYKFVIWKIKLKVNGFIGLVK